MFWLNIFFEFSLILTIVFDGVLCLPLTQRPDCNHSKDLLTNQLEQTLIKKRFKRFLYPQLLVLNLGGASGSCGCSGGYRNRYGLGTTYGPLNQFRKTKNRRYLVQRKHLLRAQPIRKQKRISLKLSPNNGNRVQRKNKANPQNTRNFGG